MSSGASQSNVELRKFDNILDAIGNTPVVRLNRLFGDRVKVWMKLEKANPCGSIKDRIALSMINDAEANGVLTPGATVIEPTSGNTGIALAMVAAVKGYKFIAVMPESVSLERRRQVKAFGGQVELTPKEKGMKGCIEKANEMHANIPNSWIPMQFENASNPEIHRNTTAQELLKAFPDGIDYLITGVGTGGHITGCAEVLKKHFPNMKAFAVEPSASAVLSGNPPGPHPIQGIGAGIIPKVLNRDILDGIIQVEAPAAFDLAARCGREEGIWVGISTGAALVAVSKKLEDIPDGAVVVTFNYDTGERYLTVPNLFSE